MVDINKFTDDELVIASLLVDKIVLFYLLSEYSDKSTSEISDYIANTGAGFLSNMSDRKTREHIDKAREHIDQARERMDNARHK